MVAFERDAFPLPPGETLDCPPPSRSLFTIADLDMLPHRRFTCRELVSDRLLYQHFQEYLAMQGGRDKLLGVRMLSIFEERITVKVQHVSTSRGAGGSLITLQFAHSPCPLFPSSPHTVTRRTRRQDWSYAEEVAWDIYCYFVAPGAAYEVPLEARVFREIQRCLASPHAHMFDALSAVLCAALKGRFQVRFHAPGPLASLLSPPPCPVAPLPPLLPPFSCVCVMAGLRLDPGLSRPQRTGGGGHTPQRARHRQERVPVVLASAARTAAAAAAWGREEKNMCSIVLCGAVVEFVSVCGRC